VDLTISLKVSGTLVEGTKRNRGIDQDIDVPSIIMKCGMVDEPACLEEGAREQVGEFVGLIVDYRNRKQKNSCQEKRNNCGAKVRLAER